MRLYIAESVLEANTGPLQKNMLIRLLVIPALGTVIPHTETAVGTAIPVMVLDMEPDTDMAATLLRMVTDIPAMVPVTAADMDTVATVIRATPHRITGLVMDSPPHPFTTR